MPLFTKATMVQSLGASQVDSPELRADVIGSVSGFLVQSELQWLDGLFHGTC